MYYISKYTYGLVITREYCGGAAQKRRFLKSLVFGLQLLCAGACACLSGRSTQKLKKVLYGALADGALTLTLLYFALAD